MSLLRTAFWKTASFLGADPGYPYLHGTEAEKKRLNVILRTTRALLPEDMPLLDIAAELGIAFVFDEKADIASLKAKLHYIMSDENAPCRIITDVGSGRIKCFPALNNKEISSAFLHELYHVVQMRSGMLCPNFLAPIEDEIWFNSIVEAAAESFRVLCLFTAMIENENIEKNLEDYITDEETVSPLFSVARAYRNDPSMLHDARLRRVAFDAWYDNADRRKVYETMIFNTYFQMLLSLNQQGAFPQMVPLNVADVEKMGTVAGEAINYLTLPGFRRLDDSHYRPKFLAELEGGLKRQIEEKYPPAGTAPLPNPGPGGI